MRLANRIQITDQGAFSLAKRDVTYSLDISQNMLTNLGAEALMNTPTICKLDMINNRWVTDKQLQHSIERDTQNRLACKAFPDKDLYITEFMIESSSYHASFALFSLSSA